MPNQLKNKGSRRLLNAWAFYDWANSTYNLVITSAIFPIFYGALFRMEGTNEVTVIGFTIAKSPLIIYVTCISFVFIALITPLVSGIADYIGNKKFFLKFFCYLGSLSCIGLYWFSLENIYYSLGCYFIGMVAFWVSFAINNSYLPDIAFPHQHDRISAKGFSLGYVGSVLLLLLNLAMVMKPKVFGITGTEKDPAEIVAMKYSFISVGIWWALFSQYTFRHLPIGYKREGKRSNIILNGFRELLSVWKQMGDQARLKRFLVAFFIYGMAVQTIMLIATYFGEEEIDWGSDSERTTGLIISILVIQLVAIIGATYTARASKSFGNIKTLFVLNMIWVLLCIYAYFLQTPTDFYIAAGLVGIVMGGIQALSRSTYSKYLPETTDTASFFSFYDVTEKIGIILGLLVSGFATQLEGNMRIITLIMAALFLVGGLLLLRVEPRKKA